MSFVSKLFQRCVPAAGLQCLTLGTTSLDTLELTDYKSPDHTAQMRRHGK